MKFAGWAWKDCVQPQQLNGFSFIAQIKNLLILSITASFLLIQGKARIDKINFLALYPSTSCLQNAIKTIKF
jgi:hypothetical protein